MDTDNEAQKLVPLESDTSITRNNLGQFTKGVSGNPQGRHKGSKARTTLIKQAMEEALTRDAAESFNAIVDKAIQMAKEGDKDMIKFVLGDVLKEARRMDTNDEEGKAVGKIHISFSPFVGVPGNAKEAIEGEFAEVEAHINIDPPS